MGYLIRCGGCASQPDFWSGPTQETEGSIVPLKPVKAGGGKGPWFRVRLKEQRMGRLA